MKQKILIISENRDGHIPFVAKHLTTPQIIVDPVSSVGGTELSYYFKDNKLVAVYDGNQLTDIKSVWYRKPNSVERNMFPIDAIYLDYCESAVLSHTHDLYSIFGDAFWVSKYYTVSHASNKSYQLAEASRLGFHVPDTLATSNAGAAQKFVSEHDQTIVKPLAWTFPATKDNQPTTFFSYKIHSSQPANYGGLNLAPAIFQQAIEPDFEVRVTVAGTQVFSAAIRLKVTDEASPVRDWRVGHLDDTVHFEEFSLPDDLKQKCIQLVQDMGLVYGAIDLIVDPKGMYWFLEINPNGQWAFVEDITGQPIGKSIARMLEKAERI